ncbi:MAG: BamA/TamA family outer membrane protein [Gammaproteobacteria bacterium]|nr:BamA/TamA family outer membrane protein [Gammaproteobacteria bacterium]
MPCTPDRGLPGAALAVLLALASAPSGAETIIDAVRFQGNQRTDEDTLLREMHIRVGAIASEQDIERSRQAIMDLGLFRSVTARTVREAQATVLVVGVEEKRYLIVLPTLSRNADGDYRWGARGRLENLWGRNHRLSVSASAERKHDAEVERKESLNLDYRWPRIRNGPWTISTVLDVSRAELDARQSRGNGRYGRELTKFTVDFSRWLRRDGPSAGWQLHTGLKWSQRDYHFRSGTPDLFEDGALTALRAGVSLYDVRDHLYSRSGREFSYRLEIAEHAFGGDINYTHQVLESLWLHPLSFRPHSNLNLRLAAGGASRDLFGEEFFELGGASSLRGYSRNDVKGNAMLLASAEFLTPIRRSNPALRAVAFLDAGNAWAEWRDMDLGDLQVGIGIGLRWVLRSFVHFQLRLDMAYAMNNGDTRFYAGAGNSF